MSQNLLAPPKVKPRMFAAMIGVLFALPTLGGVWSAFAGVRSVAEVGWRLLILGVLWCAAVQGYARLLRFSRTMRPERMPFVHMAIGMSSFILMAAAMRIMFGGTALASAAAGGFMIPLMAGMFMVSGGVIRRVGESLHCPKCEYEFAFSEGDAPARCPECGTEWIGKLRKGRRVKSGKMIGAGLAIAILGTALLQPIFWLGPVAKILPTSLLYAALYAEPRGFMGPWDELATRPLAPRWIEFMGDRVVSFRNRNPQGSGGESWFDKMETAAKMPARVVDRAHREAFAAELVVPDGVPADQPFTAHLRVSRAAGSFGSYLGIMFGGYSIDGGDPVGRKPEAVWAFQIKPGIFSARRKAFEQPLTIAQLGEHKVKVVYWIVIQPSFWPVQWGPDGEPVQPARATWFQRVEEEHTVLVR